MIIITKLKAQNNTDGNPRRGWHVQEFEGRALRDQIWIEEGFHGDEPLREWQRRYLTLHPGATVLMAGEYNVPATEYRRLRNLFGA